MAINDKAPQIAEMLRADIAAGRFPPGSDLPSQRELVASFGAARPTVTRALHLLAEAGHVYLPGRGHSARVVDPDAAVRQSAQCSTVVAELTALRRRSGYSQRELAALSGLSQSQVCELETGVTHSPGLGVVTRYAAALGARLAVVPDDQSPATDGPHPRP